ncbi:MAG TPA: inner-membrane translocator [Kofleriaceae bacterium]|jgi:ABC-type xylose transport system permease subunit|nr:inner-membrane translocator [Kofleriaceae bacterium]
MKLERSAHTPRRAGDTGTLWLAGVLAGLWLVLAAVPGTRGVFLTQANLATLLVQSSVLLVISVGMTLVILIRGIDLSVGAGVALTGTVAAMLQLHCGASAPVAILAALAVGALLGAWHGLWTGWIGVPSFIVTLAGFKAYRGGALVLSGAKGLSPMSAGFEQLAGSIPTGATYAAVLAVLALGVGLTLRDAQRRKQLQLAPLTSRVVALRIAVQVALAVVVLAVFGDRGMPVLVVIAAAVAIAGVFVTRRTRFGRHLYAIGGNPEAARLSGIDVRKTTLGAFLIVGVLTALAGVMLAARVNGVTPGSQGNLLELDAVTAVVIGGTALGGGRGSVIGTVLGTLVFSTLANGMNHLRVDSNLQLIFTGLVLLVAVGLSKGKRP